MSSKWHLSVQPRALADMQDGYDWYEDQHQGLGEQFLKSVSDAFELIERSAKRFKSNI